MDPKTDCDGKTAGAEKNSGCTNATKQNEETIVDIETVFKLAGFLLWPFLLAFLCYLFDIKGFLCCTRKGNPHVDQKTEN